jgi:crotonobetainyl-CoA:carnitine CoA-transferase CaiB-like acyl-CoA transferase
MVGFAHPRRSGDAAPLPSGPRVTPPLAGVRVLAIEQFGAGPWATLQLADLGADVIKVEDPTVGGDVGRSVPPYQEDEDSLFFETFNRNKRSVSLDLRHERGREVLLDLVAAVDVVFSNLRGDQPRRLGLLYEQLAERNPRIVCCSLSGFGMTGPRAKEGGYDYIMQGLAGWMSLTGEPDGPPAKSGLSLVDLSGGYVAAIAILAGLWRAQRDGVGCDCDISLFETALAELMYVGTWTASRGYEPPRRANSAHPSIVPFQNFRTADGWVVVACAKPKFWVALCDVLGRPDLAGDERFADFAARDANRDDLLAILDAAFAERATDDWLEALAAAGVPSGRVNTVAEALEDEQTRARDAVVGFEHPRLGSVRAIATPLRVGDEAPPVAPGPARGEHTDAVLRDLCGYDAERLAALRRDGVFGDR